MSIRLHRLIYLSKSYITFAFMISFFLFMTAPSSVYAENLTAEQWSNRGDEYLNSKQYEQAIASYDKAIAINPKSRNVDNAYLGSALAYYALNKYEQAIVHIDKVIAIDPRYEDAYYIRGLAYAGLKKYAQAIASYDKTIAINSKSGNAYYMRALAYVELEKYEQAITSYDKAIAIDPQNSFTYCGRGIAYHNLQKYEQAIENSNKAITIDPRYEDAYYIRGLAYAGLKKYEQAIASYDEAIAISPQHSFSYNGRGLAYAGLKKYEQAIASYDKAIAIDPRDKSFYNNRDIAYKANEFLKSQAENEAALRIRNEAYTAFNALAKNYWWVISGFGGMKEDYGDTIYLMGSFARIGGGLNSEQQDSVNIKLVNVNRNLINITSYNFDGGGFSRPHVYLRTEEGRNAFNMIVPIYVFQFDYDAAIQLQELQEKVNQAEKQLPKNNSNDISEDLGGGTYRIPVTYSH